MQCEFKCTNINPPMQDKYTNTITPIQCKYIYTNTIQIQIHRHVWGCHERQSRGRHVSTQLTQIGSNGLRCTVYCTKYKYIYTDTNTTTNTNTYTQMQIQLQIQIQLTQIGSNGLRCTVHYTNYIYSNFKIQQYIIIQKLQYIASQD